MATWLDDRTFLAFNIVAGAIPPDALAKLKERQAALSFRQITLHQLSYEDQVLSDEHQARLLEFAARRAGPQPSPAPAAPAPPAPPPPAWLDDRTFSAFVMLSGAIPQDALARLKEKQAQAGGTLHALASAEKLLSPEHEARLAEQAARKTSAPAPVVAAPAAPVRAPTPPPVPASSPPPVQAPTPPVQAPAPPPVQTPAPAPRAPAPVAPPPPPAPEPERAVSSKHRLRTPRVVRPERKAAPVVPLAAAGLLVLTVITVAVVFSKNSPTPEPPPPPPISLVPPPPPPPPPPVVEPKFHAPTPTSLMEGAIARARELTKAGRFDEAKAAIQAQLADPSVKASAIATDLGKNELEAIARRERVVKPATPAEPDDSDAPSTEPSTPSVPKPKRKKPAEPGSSASRDDILARVRALDLAAARAMVEVSSDAKDLRGAIDARALYLDSLGARVVPETRVLMPDGKRARVVKVSQAGVDVEGSTLAWPSLSPAALVELVSALEGKGGADACEGAALVLYDLGLWQRADARVKAWLDAQPDAKARAVALVALARGVAASDFVWKNEWLTPGEEDARVKDLVTFDGQTCTREEARRQIGKQKDDRAKVRKQKLEADAKKRAEALRRDYGVTDIRTLVNNGDPAKRCDIVVISDGFSKDGMPAFEKKADLVAAALLTVEPFCNYQKYVNVHRIEIEEPKNGLGGTRIGARANGDAITCDKDAARRYAALAPDCDLVVVVANVRNLRATGSMGRRPGVITLEMSDVVGDVVLHELGHSFAGLEDEYEDAGLVPHFPDFGDEDEWRYVNATRQSNPRLCKWHYWLLPPALPPDRTVGCVEGSYYRGSGGGYFRPSNTCRMHGENHHYCAVCLEQLEKEFYKTLEPIDDAIPRTSELAIGRDEVAHFEADTLVIEAATEKFGSFAARWFVDGKRTPAKSAGHRTQLDLSGQDATAGDHEVTLRLDLKDTRVRRDAGLLSSTRGWKVKVLDTGRPKIGAPDKVTVRRGELVSFDATLDAGPADARVAADFPAGAFVPAGRGGHFVWAPPRDAHGAYRVLLSAGSGALRVERPVDVVISDEGREVSPIFKDPPIVHAVRGQRLELPLEAVSPSGDALVYTATKPLPLGATLDPSGLLRWTPGWAGGFTSEVEVSVRVSDGKATDDLTFRIHVESRPITKAKGGFDLLAATRSPDDDVRALALEALPGCDLPLDCKLLELARLMRDRVPEISNRAIELLRVQPAKAGADAEKALHVRRNLLVLDQQDRAWEFTDRKEARALLADLAKETYEAEPKTAAGRLAADLAAIEKYNKDRGLPP